MIRILEDRVVNKIAAGEVIERPASVVKELIENAVDAGARAIRVTLASGGRKAIEVADDGCGMGRDDAMLCIERHATSKIRDDADLFRVTSLGFRGEALASIAAVSRFELVTRPADADIGTRVVVEGGRLIDVRDAGAPPGTRVSVRTIFFNVPARRKFLRSVPTEQGHCIEAVTRELLVRPEIDIEVVHDGRTVLRSPRLADRAGRAADLLGPHGEALVPVAFRRGVLEVEALVSPVGVHRSSPQGTSYLYVNGRFVRDAVLRRAVNDAYRGIVPKGRYPTVVLEVRLPPEQVDVNVHPAKTEVRFRHARDVQDMVAQGLRQALEKHGIKRPVATEARYRSDASPPSGGGQTMLSMRAAPGPILAKGALPPRGAMPSGPRASAPREGAVRAGAEPPESASGAAAEAAGPPPEVADREPPPFAPLSGVGRGLLPVPRFQDLRVIGQLARTYILCEGAGELVIVDQHAAHERITLHRLSRNAGSGAGQRLLSPLVVELSPARASALEGGLDELMRYGLELEPFGGGAFAVKQIPAALAGADIRRMVEDVADEMAEGGGGANAARDHMEHVLATLACHTSVRAGQELSLYEMRELLRTLDEVDFSVCAHGRPVTIRIDPRELERRFHRS